uniref:Non-specific serine/threonine protein kinase n=1 Tax=Angiostrongylus cantonensis TaxID=6313 RepID=A0A158P9R1_ANGCA
MEDLLAPARVTRRSTGLQVIQANRDLLDDEDVQPALFCAGRRGRKKTRLDSIGEKSVRDMSDQGVNTETHPLVSRGMNTYPTLCRTQSIETDVNDVVNRSVATDATVLVNRSMETSRQESVELTNMPWDEKVYRDMMTSPILQRLLFKTTGTAQQSVSSGDIQVVDEFQQTSLSIDRPRPMADQTVQTSMSIDRPLRSVVDQLVQTSISITLPSGADQSLQTSVNTDTPPQRSVSDQSLQTSMNTDRLQRSVADQSVQTSISTDAPPRSVADQSVQTSISTDITLSSSADQSLQTSMNTDRPQRSVADQSLQASMSIDTPPRSAADQSVQTSISMDLTLSSCVGQSLETSMNTDTPPQRSFTDQSVQASISGDITLLSLVDQSLQRSLNTDTTTRRLSECHFSSQFSPDVVDKVTSPMIFKLIDRSAQGSLHELANKCSSVAARKYTPYCCGITEEVIIQTDDSYLKLARRLDEYRSNRTQFLPVVAASPLGSRDIEPFKGDRPSERCGYYLDIKGVPRRRSIKLHQRGSQKTKAKNLVRVRKSVDIRKTYRAIRIPPIERAPEKNNNEKSRSISPMSPPRPRRRLARVVSLPAGVARGKVGEYIAKHERGIPNPAIGRDRPVRIVRQYAMVDKET